TKDELLTLYGIGEARADKIIEYRINDRIDTFNELRELLGVSNEIISKIKSQAVLQ
ncbi:MAG: helix-hairpin-helix domain-containing protein, partial [Acholeplasmatales bacterium]|nr:helix-hairpin-helix domain-containing protein [Acholeplasmatales bacterium]